MKNVKHIDIQIVLFLSLSLAVIYSCERDLSDDVVFATFNSTGEVFLDEPVGLGSDFYFPFLNSKATAFSVDDDEGFESDASIRIDVPNANDPEGSFAGAIFRIDGAGRDLTRFDALTFYAKASQGVVIGEIGFGQDFGENRYQATRTNVTLGTQWSKYVVPIPDPSKLIEERGMLWYSAGTSTTNGAGYTFWLDEVKFEKLGTVAQSRPAILNGEDVQQEGFLGVPLEITGLTQTFNVGSGENVTVIAKPSYFSFETTDINVAVPDELGIVSILGTGEATITASVANVAAAGSLGLTVTRAFDFAPTPPARDPGDVISIFSDAYANVAVDYFNGFFIPDGQTTQGGAPPLDLNGDMVINYTDLNFVGIGFFDEVPPVNATDMTTLHLDIKVNEAIGPGDFIRLELLNSVGNNQTAGSFTIDGSALTTDQWVSFDIPLADFTGLSDRSQLGLLFFISDSTISDIFVDNIYFYR